MGFVLLAAIAGIVSARPAAASPITAPVASLATDSPGRGVTINFSELKTSDGKTFGGRAGALGQPYAGQGLLLSAQQVDANALLTPVTPVAVRSAIFSTASNADEQILHFVRGQRWVGFNVKSPRASELRIEARSRDGRVIESTLLAASTETRYTGFFRDGADIASVRIVGNHATLGDALSAPTVVSDVSFSFEHDEEKGGDFFSGPPYRSTFETTGLPDKASARYAAGSGATPRGTDNSGQSKRKSKPSTAVPPTTTTPTSPTDEGSTPPDDAPSTPTDETPNPPTTPDSPSTPVDPATPPTDTPPVVPPTDNPTTPPVIPDPSTPDPGPPEAPPVVPEPGTAMMLSASALLLLGRRRGETK